MNPEKTAVHEIHEKHESKTNRHTGLSRVCLSFAFFRAFRVFRGQIGFLE